MPVFKRLPAFFLTSSLVLLVTMALAVTAVRVFQPFANDYRDALAQALGQRLGYRVSIEALRLGLVGLEPRLTLERVRLDNRDDGTLALSLKAIELDVDVLASLRIGSPQYRALTLVGARLTLERSEDGRLRILGLGALKADDPRALSLFLQQGRLRLVDSEVLFVDQGRGGKLLHLTQTRLSLDNDGTHHRLELSARPTPPAPITTETIPSVSSAMDAPPDGNRLRLLAVLDGPPEDPWSWSGRLYLSVGGANLGLLMPAVLQEQGRLDTEKVLLESWLRIKNGRLEQTLARADLTGVTYSPVAAARGAPRADSGPLQVPRFHALARARRLASGWQVRVADLNASLNGADVSGVGLDLGVADDGSIASLGASAAHCELAALGGILKAGPWTLPAPVGRLLETNPRGRLQDLSLRAEAPRVAGPGVPWQWRASASLSDLGFDHKAALPGLTGLDLRVLASEDGGELRLASRAMTLDLAPLFNQRLSLDQFGAGLKWWRQPDGTWHLSGHEMTFENADLGGRARLDLDFPAAGGSPFMDLRATFQDGNGAHVRPYLPAGVMDPKLVTWLDESIVSGHVTQADLVFRGILADYPFRQRQGHFELLLEFEDLLLDYQKGWPPIEAAAGYLRFLDEGMTIRVDRGRIYDSVFSDGRADLPELRGAKRMSIHGEARGPFSDARRTLAETPLAKELGHLAGVLEVTGESHLALDIDLPFEKDHHLGVVGRLTWPKPATLGIRETPFVLSGLNGSVIFTEKSIEARSVAATLWGRAMNLSISTEGVGDADTSITRIQARARTPVKDLAARLPSPLWNSIAGQLDWDLAVSLHNRDVNQERLPLDFRLVSPLRGVSIAMPSPLGKAVGAPGELALAGTLVPGQTLSLAGHLGQLATHLRFDLAGSPARLVGGRIRLGAVEAPAPETDGLRLDGSLKELDVPAWLAWSESLDSAGKRPDSAGNGPGGDPGLAGIELDVKRLRLGELTLTDASLGAVPGADGWQVRVRSNEVSGQVAIPRGDGDRPLRIDLDRLNLKTFLPASGTAPSQIPTRAEADPIAKLPSLNLRVAKLQWGDAILGRLDLALRKDASGVRLPRVNLNGPGLLTMKGDGDWMRGPDGGRSRIDLALETRDLGKMLTSLDEKSVVQARDATAKIALAWPGGLTGFALRRAEGTIDLKVGAGRFPEVEPGVGRLLGFLNLSALGRRLALDFSDLYGQGFAFERMAGRVAIGQGQAKFNDFLIEGNAGKVIVGGFTDLSTQRFEQVVTVEPKLGSSVALASAVAGGPAVGAAVYLVDRVTGNPIDRLGRYQYRVTGPWSDPEFTRGEWDPLKRPSKPGEMPVKDARPKRERNHFLDVE